MKYVISKEQYGEIMEGPFDSFKNRMEYHLNMGDKKKYPGKPTYSMYVMMKAYQEIVDRVFKYANKEFPFEGVKGLLVATAFSRGSIMSGPEHITVSLWPILDENNPFKGTQEEFDKNTEKFSDIFNKNMELRQLHKFWPLDGEKKVRNHFNISPMKISTVMLESHPEFWGHNLFIKRRLDMIKKVVTDTYAYKHPCEFFSAESFIHSLINDDIHVILWDDEFTDGQILDVKDFVEDNYKDILISYWNSRCGKSVVKEGYIPPNFVKRRLEDLENVVYMAMNSHDDERDFHDFVERCFEYVFSYYSDHSTLPRDYIEELVDYVGEYMFPILEKHFLEVRSMEGDKPDVVVEQFEFARIQKYWDRIEKETGFKITDEDIEREKSISGGLKFENGGMDPEALNAFKSLQNDCKGLKMDDDSYRSYDKQTDLFIESVKRKGGIKQAMTYRAIPGFSQHHTGKAIDLEKPDSLRACAKKHASKHNFIFPYEGDGVRMAEPWHIYYNK